MLAFDGDEPGLDSNVRLAVAAAERGREVLLTLLPTGHDPDSWLAAKGPAGLAAWSPASRLTPVRFPVTPVLPGGVVTRHLWNEMREAADRAGRPFDRTAALERLLSVVAGPGIRLDDAAARRWAASVGEPLGHMAVAEARQYLGILQENAALRAACTTGPQALSGGAPLTKRVASWARRLPSCSRASFSRGAYAALAGAHTEHGPAIASAIQRELVHGTAETDSGAASDRMVVPTMTPQL